MSDTHTEPAAPPRWLHAWAVLTVGATLVLLVLGSLVTTRRAGMADRDWPTHPLQLLREDYVEGARRQGYAPILYLIEHSHRLAGYAVGCCAIVLALGLWIGQRQRGLAWLGTLVLLGVVAQGVLGGFRVLLNDLLGTDLATIHGCFAQVVLALMVSLVVCTSRAWWQASPTGATEGGRRLQRLALLFAVLVFGEILFGAVVRHTHQRLAQRGHFLLAFAVVAVAVWLIRMIREQESNRGMTRAGWVLALLLIFQLALGVEVWLMRFGTPLPPELQPVTRASVLLRTFHFATGSLIFATAIVIALLSRRGTVGALPWRAVPTTLRERSLLPAEEPESSEATKRAAGGATTLRERSLLPAEEPESSEGTKRAAGGATTLREGAA